jgi:hypothetical protein
MRIIQRLLMLLILPVIPVTAIFAQQGIPANGGEAISDSGTVSWTVGLVAYSTSTSGTGSVLQCVQHPYEIFLVDGIKESKSEVHFLVFPNPTTGEVTLSFSEGTPVGLCAGLYDPEGKQLRWIALDKKEVTISMDDLSSATYLLTIFEKNQPIRTYKIIKR